MRVATSALFSSVLAVFPAFAETEFGFYGGGLHLAESRAIGSDPSGIGSFDFLVNWQNAATVPPSFGVRLTHWQSNIWGWGIDYSRISSVADDATLSDNGLVSLGFSDGLNILTVNRYRQWRPDSAIVPYVGAGIGMSFPRFRYESAGNSTQELQLGGPAVSLIAGARYPVGEQWSLFGEYKGTFSANSLDLPNSGIFQSGVLTNSINFGASFGF